MEEITLANLIPVPQPGEWYFVYSSMESNNKIVVLIDKGGHSVISDINLGSGIAYYFKPEKIKKEEAREFLKRIISEFEKEKDPKANSTDRVLIRGMKLFFRTQFKEEI